MGSNDRAKGRPLAGPLTFAVSPDELALLDVVKIRYPNGRARPIMLFSGIVWLANGVLQVLLGSGVLEPRTTMAPVHLAIGLVGLVLAPTYFFGFIKPRTSFSRSRLSGDGEHRFAMYEGGLAFERPASLVPWARVREIHDVGDAFIVRTTFRRRIVPKRIFDDAGDAVWGYAASRMTGGRMLVVPKHRRVLRNSVAP